MLGVFHLTERIRMSVLILSVSAVLVGAIGQDRMGFSIPPIPGLAKDCPFQLAKVNGAFPPFSLARAIIRSLLRPFGSGGLAKLLGW